MSPEPFDPVAYKRMTTTQWQTAAEPWHRWAPTLEAWLGEATETMLDLAGVTLGASVLDVAAGAGGQTLAAARRVGPGGHVLATDISSNILAFAERSARERGVRNVETRVLDGENWTSRRAPSTPLSRASVSSTSLTSRRVHRYAARSQAGRPPGRDRLFDTRSQRVLLDPGLDDPPPGAASRTASRPAGPVQPRHPWCDRNGFRAGRLLRRQHAAIAAPLRLPSTAEFVRFARESFGALHQMLAGLSEAEREDAWSEIERELSRYETPRGFEGPCELIVASGMAAP